MSLLIRLGVNELEKRIAAAKAQNNDAFISIMAS